MDSTHLNDMHLLFKTDHAEVDDVLLKIIRRFELVFPDKVLAYYLDGSYASSYAVPSSDVDLKIVFKEDTAADDLARANEMIVALDEQSAIEFDVGCVLAKGQFRPALIYKGQLIYGKEIRNQLTVMPVDFWGRERMYAGCWLICHLFDRPGKINLPLGYPDPEGSFYGYDDRLAQSGEGKGVRGIKNMMRASGWAATGLIGHQTGKYVTNKAECLHMYREFIGDEWTSHIEDLYENCRNKWVYRVPDDVEEQKILRTICQRNLAFENHFLNVYRNFLIDELQCGDVERIKEALDYFNRTPFHDEAVVLALKKLITVELIHKSASHALGLVT